jgi:hypothetical protein
MVVLGTDLPAITMDSKMKTRKVLMGSFRIGEMRHASKTRAN